MNKETTQINLNSYDLVYKIWEDLLIMFAALFATDIGKMALLMMVAGIGYFCDKFVFPIAQALLNTSEVLLMIVKLMVGT